MSPPLYAELGRPAHDLFTKGYNFGIFKVDVSSRPDGNCEFKSIGVHNMASGKLTGNVDVKYKMPEYGLTVRETWNTDNSLGTEVSVVDRFARNTKFVAESLFSANSGKRVSKLKAEYRHDTVTLSGDANLNLAALNFNVAAVVGYQGWFFGYHTGFDVQHSKQTHNHISVGRRNKNYALHTYVKDGTEFGGSVFHIVNDSLQLGSTAGWTIGEEGTKFGIAAKYQVDRDMTLRAKFMSTSQFGLAWTQCLKPGLKIHLSALLDLQRINDGSHRLGIGIEYDQPKCC